ncbi:hypothetical protein ACFW6V_12325 [Streptomyces sp. NPDC058734]|uniref:hypothetical protein n=1 Tax=Streptomyces sp. NPDC058734 TaxID=3346615 RepID=UPI00368974F1
MTAVVRGQRTCCCCTTSRLGVVATGVGATRAEVRLADYNGDGRDDYYWVSDGGAIGVWLCNGIVRKVASS